VLAVPLTLLVKATPVDSDPQAGCAAALLGSRPTPIEPPEPAPDPA
jgi:hypothetical protein